MYIYIYIVYCTYIHNVLSPMYNMNDIIVCYCILYCIFVFLIKDKKKHI